MSCGHGPMMDYKRDKRIAVLAPVAWRTPPCHYGAWETVASNITEGLVARGWNVTLFATANSVTKAMLHSVIPRGYQEDKSLDPKVVEYHHISEAFEHAHEYDLLHSHYDFMALTYTAFVHVPVLTTIHGFSSSKILPIYHKYNKNSNVYFVSISDSDRAEGIDYCRTVYNGVELKKYDFVEAGGEDLIFIGRIHPDKGVEYAIETAKKCGRRLIIAGIIQDEDYFNTLIKPAVDDRRILFIGPVTIEGKNKLFKQAYALLHLNVLPERFGLVLAEANAAGVPVIAMDRGSCREVIEHGETGFIVNSVDEAVSALEKVPSILRSACRGRVEKKFSVERMVSSYEEVYQTIFTDQAKKKGAPE